MARSRGGGLIGGLVGEDLRRKMSLEQALDLVAGAPAGNSGGSGIGPTLLELAPLGCRRPLAHPRGGGGRCAGVFRRRPRSTPASPRGPDFRPSSSGSALAWTPPSPNSGDAAEPASGHESISITKAYDVDVAGSPVAEAAPIQTAIQLGPPFGSVSQTRDAGDGRRYGGELSATAGFSDRQSPGRRGACPASTSG